MSHLPAETETAKGGLIEPKKGDKRLGRRNADDTFGNTAEVRKTLSAASRTSAKKTVPKGQGDRGDTKR